MSDLIYPYGVLRVFFSLRCNFNCGYCSMYNQKDLWRGDEFTEASPDDWIKAFERLKPTRKLIVTPCNAEPAIYEGCADIVNKGLARFTTYFYTNLSNQSMEEIRKFNKRDNLAFYVSYHRGQIDIGEFITNAQWLQKNYNVVNFHAPLYPPFKEQILEDAITMKKAGVLLDTTHEYLGMYKGEMHYAYLGGGNWIKKRLAHRLTGEPKKKVLCRTSPNHTSFFSRAYTVAPDGDIYTCWRYLYNHDKDGVLGSFFDPDFQFKDEYFECEHYGDCNICAWHKNIKDAETGEQLDTDIEDKSGKTISACLMVRNEGDILADCLHSIKDWVDEIVIVDTGSTDNTLEIAKQFNARIFNQPWEDNFSLHRNYSMQQATKDWIFIIDADERVFPGHGENLKKMLPDIKQDVISVDVYNLYGKDRAPKSNFKSLRFFRRGKGFHYKGRVHNKPMIMAGCQIYNLPFRINHLGYDMSPEVMAEKYDRRLRMCRRWIEEEPDELEAYFQLARSMKVKDGKANLEEYPEIVKILESGINRAAKLNGDPGNMYPQLLNLMAWIKYAMQEHDAAINYGKRALALIPDYLDSILIIGLAYTCGVSALEGEKWLLRYLREQEAFPFRGKLDCVVMEHAYDRRVVYEALIDIEDWKEKNHKQ